MTCTRCGRPIKHPVYFGGNAYGSHCGRAVGGVKAKRRQRAQRQDEKQAELFAEVLP
jgi:hypothetical protein